MNGFDLADDGAKIAYVLNEAGAETLHVLDLKTRQEIPLPRLALGTIGSLRFRADSKELAFSLSSARSPSDVYSVDVTAGRREVARWTESETGGLDPATFPEPEAISWKSFDGRTITGFLYRPPASFAGPRPVIVNIHGGPEGEFQPGFLGRNNFFMNELGVAMIFPNVRGSSGFGKTYLALDNGEKREDTVKDVGALLDWIAAQPGLDRSRVMVTGGSYGGYMTLASMTHYNDRFRCAIDVVGISNWVTFLEHTEGYRRDLRRVEYGDERDPKMRAFLEKVSPLTSAGNITKPMFIVAGRNDPRVPYTEAEQMVAAIKKNGGPVWFLMANDEGHGFSQEEEPGLPVLRRREVRRGQPPQVAAGSRAWKTAAPGSSRASASRSSPSSRSAWRRCSTRRRRSTSSASRPWRRPWSLRRRACPRSSRRRARRRRCGRSSRAGPRRSPRARPNRRSRATRPGA